MTETQENSSSSLSGTDAAIRQAVRDRLPSTIADLSQLVRLPSVSWNSFDPENVVKSAEAVAELARGTGIFDTVEIKRSAIEDTETLGRPAVLAKRAAKNGRPTILLYAHHDVQPPGNAADWDTPPFEPTVKGDRLYGRGAADDKAGVMAHIGAIRALTDAVGADLDLGIALFVEGEEESGSLSFSNFLVDNREALQADTIVVADSNNWDTETPALTVGLRGNVKFTLTVSTLAHASHSGMFGGAVPDSMLATIRLLSTLWNEDGSVAVDGLTTYDGDTPDYDEEQLRQEAGILEGVTPIGRGSILSRIWGQPSITVTGIDAPSTDAASNTLAPTTSVVLSIRIAPGQNAEEALQAVEAHLRAHAPFGAHISLAKFELGNPFLVDTSGESVRAAKQAMADAWGVEPVELGIGGSIPFIADLVREFPNAEILVTGVEDPDSRAHSPNESLHLGVFEKSLLAEALLLGRMNAQTSGE